MEQKTASSNEKSLFAVKGFFTAKNIAYLAVLLALVVVLQIFASAIPVGAATLNFSLVPIVLGAILLGPWGGMILGFGCGVVVLIQVIVLTGNAFYQVIWTNSPVITTLICILKTTFAGLLSGLVYRLLERKNKLAAVFVASGLVPIVNTGLFIFGCLCMNGTIKIFQDLLGESYAGMNVFVIILVVLVSFNFFIEFAINLVLAPAIYRVVTVVEKQIKKRSHKKLGAGKPEESAKESGKADKL